jgi:hypothetical protein
VKFLRTERFQIAARQLSRKAFAALEAGGVGLVPGKQSQQSKVKR